MLHLLQQQIGFHGLRVVHVAMVVTIVWQTHCLFRRASGSHLAAFAAGATWLALSWYRLIQLRPHLFTLLAALLLYRLLFESNEVQSATRALAGVAPTPLSFLTWFHFLFRREYLAPDKLETLRSFVRRLKQQSGVRFRNIQDVAREHAA